MASGRREGRSCTRGVWCDGRRPGTGRRHRMVDDTPRAHSWASDGRRLLARKLEAEPRARRQTRCGLPRWRPDHLAAGADVRRRVLLVLALARAADPILGLLVTR